MSVAAGTPYAIRDTASVFSPGLLFYKEIIVRNIARLVEVAGSAERLRPHVKTHKTREIVRLEQGAGVRKHKCATPAEAEMLADCGVTDVLLAYPVVGPNCERLARLARRFPACRFAVTADHPKAVRALSEAVAGAGAEVDVLLDLDVGQQRTGVPAGEEAVRLYQSVSRLPGLRPGGIHAYDGHNHQCDPAARGRAAQDLVAVVQGVRGTLEGLGLPVPRIVVGGTPTFPFYARQEVPGLECSPGTCVLHDQGYGKRFPDLAGFAPAALLLTRVVSRPTPRRVTFDLGTKAVASDPPAGERLQLLGVGDYRAVLHNEEHLVIETSEAERFQPGDTALAVPTHICPTCALHRFATVIEDGRAAGQWEIAARDRVLTV